MVLKDMALLVMGPLAPVLLASVLLGMVPEITSMAPTDWTRTISRRIRSSPRKAASRAKSTELVRAGNAAFNQTTILQ